MQAAMLNVVEAATTDPRVVPPFWRLVVKKANPITPLNSQGCGPAFYCVHPIAGDVTSFYSLARHLDKAVRLYGIQVPLEKMDASFGGSVAAMASFYVEAVTAFQPMGPVALGGWSAGAIIALEMAQQLRARGRVVSLLVALDGAPCNTDTAIDPWHPVFIWKVVRNLPFWILDECRQAATWSDLLRHLRVKLAFRFRRAFPVIRNEQTLHGDAVQSLLESRSWSDAQMKFIRSLYEALRIYRPRSYGGPVLVIESRTQPLFSLRQIGAAWRTISPRARIVTLKSNHQGIFREPTLSILVECLRRGLDDEK